MSETVIGLRDRKRIETRERLERAALDLVSRDGLDATTIDAISDAADVSTRTFFNYFDSKDDAVMGSRDIDLDAETVRLHLEQHAGESTVQILVSLLVSVMATGLSDPEIRRQRKELLHRYPQLLGRQMARMTRTGETIVTAVADVMRHDLRFADLDDDRLQVLAQVMLPLCAGAIKVGVHDWVEAGRGDDGSVTEKTATALVQEIVERLK